jgi:acetyl esterase/lipase
MKKKSFPRLLFSCAFFGFLALIECRKPAGPACTVKEAGDYFVNPTPAVYAALGARSAPLSGAFPQQVRSLVSLPDSGAILKEWLRDSAGQPYCAGYCTPEHGAADTSYPLIIYLHGGIGTERNDKGDSAFLMLKDLADTFRLFLASPSANRYAPWWSPQGVSRILQTLRFMTLHFPVDPDKVFLAGVSDGATGCYAAANTIPGPFAGFIAVSGFGGMLPQVGMRLEPGNLMLRPVYNVNAGLDRLYPIDAVKAFVAGLQAQGVPITAAWYDNEQHGFDYRAKEMGTLATLIRTWSKPKQGAISWNFVPGFPNLPDNILAWNVSAINASASGFRRNDTLFLRTQGLSSLTLAFPAGLFASTINCRLLADSDNVRTIKLSPVNIGWPEQMQIMMHRCFPATQGTVVYNVKP